MKIKTLLLTALCLICTSPVFADFRDGDFIFRENGSNCTLIEYTGAGGDVTIPSVATKTYNGPTYTVTVIGDNVFYGSRSLTSVIIPNGVLEIGKETFFDCSELAKVTIGNSVTTIGDRAFGVCYSLTSITIPNSVTTIGDRAFENCPILTEVTIGNSVKVIGVGAFGYCERLTEIKVADGNISWASEDGVLYNKSKSLLHSYPGGKSGSFTIPSSVTEIATTAFYGCTNLSSVTIPNSVTTIGFGAFAYCNGLTSITIPNSVTAIGYAAFSVCERLMEINVADGNISWVSEDGVLYNKSKSVLRSCPGGKSRTFTIPSHVTEIDTSAFWGCTSLTSITIPNSVKTIGVAAFEECTSLTSVVIPNSVTTIREGAFNLCYGLTSVTIPKSVTAIGERAFAECPILTDVTVSWPTPLSINEHIFSTYYLSESNCTLHVPVGTKALYAAANVWKDFVTILEGDTGGDDDDEGEGDEGEGEGGDDDNGDDEGDNDDSVEAVNSNKAEVTLADGILTITSPAAEQVEVYALTGALLHKESKASGSLTLNIGHLPKGILIVRGNSGWTQKVILR